MTPPLRTDRTGAVLTVTLDRPDRHNAFDDLLIAALTDAFAAAGADPAVRVVVLAAGGTSFSAGADLAWMRRMAGATIDDNRRDAEALALLMRTIDRCPKPVLGRIQGPAYGGGVGLVACCDIALAAAEASFALTEVRLGLIPAVISPYVVAAIGARACRRYFLTGERFDAATAARLGLVHEVVPAGDLDQRCAAVVKALLCGGPDALAAAKDLIATVAKPPPDLVLDIETARRIAERRASPEGQEGLDAFLAKRRPIWRAE